MANVLKILKKVGAVIENDHIVLTSGKHSPFYMNKDSLYPHTKEASQIGKLFAKEFKNLDVDVVVGPALGGIILSHWVAYHLSKYKKKEILGVYTEKTPDKDQVFTRGYDKLVKGKKVLVIEDFVSTGGSVMKVINSIKQIEGKVIATCVMVNRDPKNITAEFLGTPLYSLKDLQVEMYDEKNCPLCKKGIPINTTVGHGKEFLKNKNLYLQI